MRAPDFARLLLLAALWGGSFAFIRVAVPALGPIWLAQSRVALAFAALLAVALIRRRVPSPAAQWPDYVVIGAVNSALPFALFSFAEQTISASNAAILNATSPFFGAVIAAVWLREPLGARKVGGMTLGLAGVVLLIGWQTAPMSGAAIVASLACLGAALCYGVGSVYAKARMTGTPSFAIALYSQLAAAIVLAPALPFVPPPLSLSPLVAANVLALALASTAIAYLLYFRLIADVGPARALTVTFLIPLFGVLWGTLFLHEAVAASMLSGCALILAGTWLTVRDARRRPERALDRRSAPS
jgi:drug/metabolite transporter (DMT)-like permease